MNVLLTTNKDVMYYFHHDRFHDMPTDAKTQFVEEKVFLTSTYFIHKKGFWTCTECFLIKRRQFLVFRKFSLFWRLFHSFSYSFTGLLPKNVTCLVSWFLRILTADTNSLWRQTMPAATKRFKLLTSTFFTSVYHEKFYKYVKKSKYFFLFLFDFPTS